MSKDIQQTLLAKLFEFFIRHTQTLKFSQELSFNIEFSCDDIVLTHCASRASELEAQLAYLPERDSPKVITANSFMFEELERCKGAVYVEPKAYLMLWALFCQGQDDNS